MSTSERPKIAKAVAPDGPTDLLTACAARPEDRVTIAGRKHVDLLVDFLRHGVAEAACRADSGPHDGHRPCDVLVIPEISSDLELLHIVAWLGCDLKQGGLLVLRDSRPLSNTQRRQLLLVLVQRGFQPTSRADRWIAQGGILRTQKAITCSTMLAA